jgi:hypothetical protein
MSNPSEKSRRSFLKKALSTAIITGASPSAIFAKPGQVVKLIPTKYEEKFGPNDRVNVAVIGMGIMGFNNIKTSLTVPGVKLVGACDLYTGHLDRAKELYGKDIFTTKDYREILERKDVDAVIVATSDHWHDRISIDAMNKGKHVYCEKPMVHKLEEGEAVIATVWHRTGPAQDGKFLLLRETAPARYEKDCRVRIDRNSFVPVWPVQSIFQEGNGRRPRISWEHASAAWERKRMAAHADRYCFLPATRRDRRHRALPWSIAGLSADR